MFKKQIDKKQAENYVICALVIITTLIFIVIPAYPTGYIDHQTNSFLNQYLFGNGWYIPSNYPFAAKVTNNLSVILAVIVGFFMGIWRRNDVVVSLIPKNFWWPISATLFMVIVMIVMSIYPQEFSTYTGWRSFFFTKSFHNNPVLFMGLMLSKTICIYVPVRALVSFTLYLFNRKNKSK